MSIRKNPVAYVALFVALGGTSYAASRLPANSVGTGQLRNGAVTDKKVRRHSLGARVFAPGVLPPLKTQVVAFSAPVGPPCPANGCSSVPAGTSASWAANCPTGTRVVGGGYSIASYQDTSEVATASAPTQKGQVVNEPSQPTDAGGWQVTFTTTQEANPGPPYGNTVYAVCASG